MNRYYYLLAACITVISLLAVTPVGQRFLDRAVTVVDSQLSTPISDIVSDPQHYHEREVVISGVTGKTIGIAGYGLYALADATGNILVFTKDGLPATGSRVAALKGMVHQSFSFGSKTLLVVVESDD